MKSPRLYEKFRFAISENLYQQVDWKLFIFLSLLLDVKLWIKIFALLFIYSFRFNFKFGLRWKKSRLPLFYIMVMGIAVLDWLLYGLYSNLSYGLVLLNGLFFWIFCLLAIHQLKLSVERSSVVALGNTVLLFFIFNMIISLSNFLAIVIETGALNPYRYQGLFQKYFISTGDYIKGLSFDTSTTNALINAFGVVFFLSNKKITLTLCCMIALILTASNLTDFILIIALIFSFVFKSDRDQKSTIVLCLTFIALFLVMVSPQNNQYVLTAANKMFNLEEHVDNSKTVINATDIATPETRRVRFAVNYLDSVTQTWASNQLKGAAMNAWAKPLIPVPNINGKEYQSLMDTTPFQRKMINFGNTHYTDTATYLKKMRTTRVPGKVIAMEETIRFLKNNPSRILTGDGMGNFSSKLAFRATALNIAVKYPEKYAYIDPDFQNNHLQLYLFYFAQHKDVHSIIHTPDSEFNQLLGEYGVAGVICLLVFYLGWFTVYNRKTSYSVPLLIIMTGAFFTGYWFEQLSVVVFFELLMLLDMKFKGESIFATALKQEM
jgi:hypothetical protein